MATAPFRASDFRAVKLLVAIVNYRVAQLVIDCLHSIATEIAHVQDVRVEVCENGSGDHSAELIQKAIDENNWHNWCSLRVLTENLGFTGGNNAILRPATTAAVPPEYALLLNPDTIVRPGAFTALIDFMDRNPKVGIAGSRLEDPDGTPQRSAFRFHSPLGELEANLKLGLMTKLLERWVVAPPVRDATFETDWVSGASMIIRRQVLETTGLLDEGYFTYFDDIDYCFNARMRGWATWYVPGSRVVHLVGQSSGVNAHAKRLPSYLLEARRRYFLKNHGAIYAATADASMIVGQFLWRLRLMLTGQNDKSPPHLLSDCIRHSVFLRGFKLSDVRARP